MILEELATTLKHVEKSLRQNQFLQNIARKHNYDLTMLYPDTLRWEIEPCRIKGKEDYLYIYTSFTFARQEHARVIIHVKGKEGFCYASDWSYYFRNKRDPLFTEKLPGLFIDFDPPLIKTPA